MGTRSIIAKPVGDTWEGRYVHWDGYPTGVGKALFEAFGKFESVEAMREALIDAEPVGWSILCGVDLTQPARWTDSLDEAPEERSALGPLSYSVRGETPWKDGTDADVRRPEDGGEAWVYVLADGGLMVGTGVEPKRIVPWALSIEQARDLLAEIQNEASE